MNKRQLCLAPMMDYTDRHHRYLIRLISKRICLFTEMVTTNTLLNADSTRFLKHHSAEHPVVIQLGGSNPKDLSQCSTMSEQAGFDEVNLNVGCPSDRVKEGRFGASLMADPTLVGNCINAMQSKVSIPVTVKCRLGIDDQDDYAHLKSFVDIVSNAGCEVFYIHARKAWLNGLSPKENRNIPPLNYESVYRIKQEFSHLKIVINGGIKSLDSVKSHNEKVDGSMIGREIYSNPYLLSPADSLIYDDLSQPASRMDILNAYIRYVENEMTNGVKLTQMSRHVLGLFQGIVGAKMWRRHISENAHKPGADVNVLLKAAEFIR